MVCQKVTKATGAFGMLPRETTSSTTVQENVRSGASKREAKA